MYVKRHTVHKGGREYVYLRLVEAYRNEQGQVRHRLLHTLGREDELKASGQLDQLAASFARLDPPPLGTRRDVGPLLVVAHYLRRFGLVSLVDETAPMRGRSLLTNGEVIAVLVANRLCGPAPLYDVASGVSPRPRSPSCSGFLPGCRTTTVSAVGSTPSCPTARTCAPGCCSPPSSDSVSKLKPPAPRPHSGALCRPLRELRARQEGLGGGSDDQAAGEDPAGLHGSLGSRSTSAPIRAPKTSCRHSPGPIDTFAHSLPPGLVVVADSGVGYLENLLALDSSKVSFVGAPACRHWLASTL